MCAYLQPGVRGVERAADRVAPCTDARADHAGRVGGRVRAAHQPDYLLGVLRRDAAVDDYFRRYWARAVEVVGVGSCQSAGVVSSRSQRLLFDV